MIALLAFNVFVVTVFLAWAVLLVALEFTAVRRGRQRVERWASSSSYQVQSVTLKRNRAGPWGSYNGAFNRVFEVVIAERSGETRTAFVKVSGGLFGLAADDVEARWVPPAVA